MNQPFFPKGFLHLGHSIDETFKLYLIAITAKIRTAIAGTTIELGNKYCTISIIRMKPGSSSHLKRRLDLIRLSPPE